MEAFVSCEGDESGVVAAVGWVEVGDEVLSVFAVGDEVVDPVVEDDCDDEVSELVEEVEAEVVVVDWAVVVVDDDWFDGEGEAGESEFALPDVAWFTGLPVFAPLPGGVGGSARRARRWTWAEDR